MSSEPANQKSLLPVVTLVVWMTCAIVSALGMLLSYPAPRQNADSTEPLPTQIVEAQLTPQPKPPPVVAPISPPDPGPPTSEPPAPAQLPAPPRPQLVAVAPPSPAISFALPTEGLTHVVDVAQADHTRSILPATGATGTRTGGGSVSPTPPPAAPVASAPAVARLTFGQGEGRQPPPEYPRDAVLARQQGTVGLRFTVDEDGRVASVEVISPSRWPLLNQAATRAVRDTWRFTPGPRRIYEVPIEFQLNQ